MAGRRRALDRDGGLQIDADPLGGGVDRGRAGRATVEAGAGLVAMGERPAIFAGSDGTNRKSLKMLSPRAIEKLRSMCNWSEQYRWHSEPELAAELRKLGHAPNAAALQFLWWYGGLSFSCANRYRSSTLVFHTDGIEAAHITAPIYCERAAELAGSTLCPIGECGYGDWLLAMAEDGEVWGMDMIRQWREMAESGEHLLSLLCAAPPPT